MPRDCWTIAPPPSKPIYKPLETQPYMNLCILTFRLFVFRKASCSCSMFFPWICLDRSCLYPCTWDKILHCWNTIITVFTSLGQTHENKGALDRSVGLYIPGLSFMWLDELVFYGLLSGSAPKKLRKQYRNVRQPHQIPDPPNPHV